MEINNNSNRSSLEDSIKKMMYRKTLATENTISSIISLPGTDLIVFATSDRIEFWNYKIGKFIKHLVSDGIVHCLLNIPETKISFISGSFTGVVSRISLWEYDKKECKNIAQCEGITSSLLLISGTDNIAALTSKNSIYIWNYKTGHCQQVIESERRITTSCFTYLPGTTRLVYAINDHRKGNEIFVHDFESSEVVKSFRNKFDRSKYNCFLRIPGTSVLLAGSDYITMLDYDSDEKLDNLGGRGNSVQTLAYINESRFVISGYTNGSIRIWNYITRECVNYLVSDLEIVNCLVYIPETTTIIAGGNDKIVVWNEHSLEQTSFQVLLEQSRPGNLYQKMGKNIEEIAKIEDELLPNVDIETTNKRKRLEIEFEAKITQFNEEGKKEKNDLTQKRLKLLHENKIIHAQLKKKSIAERDPNENTSSSSSRLNENEKGKCIICFDAFPIVILDVCGHTLICEDCYSSEDVQNHILDQKQCPICRKSAPKGKLIKTIIP